MLMIIGLVLFLAGGPLSAAAYKRNNPAAAELGLPPVPGSGDVPVWISGVYLLGIVLFVVGVIQLLI